MINKSQLYEFEEEVCRMFNNGELKSPVHLSGSKDGKLEDFLIKLFKKIKKEDWIFSTYRSHYHALLKGVSPEWLKKWILENKSIHVCFDKFITSAIVGGSIPIAIGTAMALKMKKSKDKVFVFCGDMTANTGIFNESYRYAVNFDLPITFIVEDNGLSTDTDTKEVWGMKNKDFWFERKDIKVPKLIHFKYTRKWPHYGTGQFVAKLWENNKEEIGSKGF